MNEKTNITAKLIRGRVYIYKNTMFKRGVETPVSEELADELENLVITSTDSRDQETIEKKRFKINRDAKVAEDDEDEDEDGESTGRKVASRIRGRPSRSNRR